MNDTKPKVIEIISTVVSPRSKWDRKAEKKLNKKVYVARFIYRDEAGVRREKTKEFLRRKDAEDHLRGERAKFDRSGGREFDAEKLSFNDLADHYEEHYAKPAEYVGDRKIGGLRSLAAVKGYVSTLREHFGGLQLKRLNYGLLRDFRNKRLRTPVVRLIKVKIPLDPVEREKLGTRKRNKFEYREQITPRRIASVNRELTTLRHMLNIAVSEGWISSNPFNSGKGLIEVASEATRQRILTKEEERRLLSVCDCNERRLLRSLLICLLDTGMRLNEAITLEWVDVDFPAGEIRIKARNTKTAKSKTVAISSRMRTELLRLWGERSIADRFRDESVRDRVFGVKSNVNRSWRTARKLAHLEDVRLHDLRHTFGTRLNHLGFSQASIARSLGHQQTSTTYRYINPDGAHLEMVRAAVDSFHESAGDQHSTDPMP